MQIERASAMSGRSECRGPWCSRSAPTSGTGCATLQGAVRPAAATRCWCIRVSPVVRDRSGGWAGPAGVPERRARRRVHGARPLELLGLAYQVEQAYGRTREVHWGARTLDVDLLVVGDMVSADPDPDPAAPPGARARLRPRAVERCSTRTPRSSAAAASPGWRVRPGTARVRARCAVPLTRWWCADATDKAAAARGHRRRRGRPRLGHRVPRRRSARAAT